MVRTLKNLALCGLLLASSLFSLVPAICSAGYFSNKYDDNFKDESLHLPHPRPTSWKLLRAQCYVESAGDAWAVSTAGALGYCQIMPNTWKQWAPRVGATDAYNKYDSLLVAEAYMKYLHGQWTAKRSAFDRYRLTLASYNAGLGNILKAQKLGDGANDYDTIISFLPQVTGIKNAKQTTDYVKKVVERTYGNR